MYVSKSNNFSFMSLTSEKVELSIIVCTRNRAKQLATLIHCLGSQTDIENLNWEIIIVDNNSSDNTKEVSYAFCEGSNLKINYVFEEKIGLSYARNTGILASKGSLLLFIDDDVLIPKEFVANALFGINEYPEFHIFGFRILPEWPEARSRDLAFKPPWWMKFKKPFGLIQSFLPIHDHGVEALQYPNRFARNPIGACFIVKKEVFEKLGPFRENLGAGQSGLCEDTEYFWYAMLNSFKILYWPHAVLYHTVDPKRLTVSYLHKWYFNLGKSLYLIKNTGRIQNEINKKDTQISLSLKLFILILLLPFSLILLIIKRPFYLSTMVVKTLGEIKQTHQP